LDGTNPAKGTSLVREEKGAEMRFFSWGETKRGGKERKERSSVGVSENPERPRGKRWGRKIQDGRPSRLKKKGDD